MPLINTTELLSAASARECKATIISVIDYILPRVMELNLEKEMLLCIAQGKPPSIPIFLYTTSSPALTGGDEDDDWAPISEYDTMLGEVSMEAALTRRAIQVLYTLLGPHFSLERRTQGFKKINHVTVAEVALVATFHAEPREYEMEWVHAMFPNLSTITISNGRVIWDPLGPRNSAEDDEEALLGRIREADTVVTWQQTYPLMRRPPPLLIPPPLLD